MVLSEQRVSAVRYGLRTQHTFKQTNKQPNNGEMHTVEEGRMRRGRNDVRYGVEISDDMIEVCVK